VDVLVSYLSGWHISPEAIKTINQMGIATCAFWWDDRLSFRGSIQGGRYSGSESLASAYDLNLTNASDAVVKYLVKGGLAMFWPEGANPEHFRPLNLPFKYDVSFVGACYGQRPAYINYLRRHGIKLEVFGPGWPNGRVSEDEMVEIYNRSRINLGFSGIGYSMDEMCLKGRDFEVPMTGALYLTSEQPDLHRVYKVGKEVVTYHGKSDCLARICYLLDHEDESKSIREAARERCVRDHTWVQRFHKVFLMMGLLNA
jgi:spore maturation protein CgeB